ncbi:uncharacterized protein BKCO1_3000236 [Diplodia corticola]|uniref:Uncharacterized protein n=1 Tax=Diplodia corticola TaxID=236234 RepID=A0A1J9RG27_9PEZI|nr:uncharacterized protein BKCO1_3000236 [Diplodia corticola]OJD39034.1 hypothetical protein BKCO1_3000236 [Diplodia corticola]
MPYYHSHRRHEHYRPTRTRDRERQSSPPPGMSSEQASLHPAPSISASPANAKDTSHQAISTLTELWGADSAAWRPADCHFGPIPRTWPPRMLTAIAGLARAAGAGEKQRDAALGLVEKMVKDEQRKEGRLSSKATPEHLNKAAELMEKRDVAERSRKTRGDGEDESGQRTTAVKDNDRKRKRVDEETEYGDDDLKLHRVEGEMQHRGGEVVRLCGAAPAGQADDVRHRGVDRGYDRATKSSEMRKVESTRPYEPRNTKPGPGSREPSAKHEQRVAPKPKPIVTSNTANTLTGKTTKDHQLEKATTRHFGDTDASSAPADPTSPAKKRKLDTTRAITESEKENEEDYGGRPVKRAKASATASVTAATKPREPRSSKPSSSPREQPRKKEQPTASKPQPKHEEHAVSKPPQTVNAETAATVVEESSQLHPQRAKRLLEDDNSEDEGARKKIKLTSANSIPLPKKAIKSRQSRSPQSSSTVSDPAEAMQSDKTKFDGDSNVSTKPDVPVPATTSVTDTDTPVSNANETEPTIPSPVARPIETTSKVDGVENQNEEQPATNLDDELASLRAQVKAQAEQLAEERAAKAHMSTQMETIKLDLDLSESARAASEKDAASWRAYGKGLRAVMKDHKRLAKVEMYVQKVEREAAQCRVGMKVAQKMYEEAETRYQACDVDVEKVKVVKGDEELRMINAVLRRENEELRMKFEKYGV